MEIKAIRVSVFPRLRVAGDAVTVRHEGRTEVPPLIAIESFSADASLLGWLGRPLRLRRVHLEGLEINVPPGGVSVESAGDSEQESGDSGEAAAATAAGGGDIQVTGDSAEPWKRVAADRGRTPFGACSAPHPAPHAGEGPSGVCH